MCDRQPRTFLNRIARFGIGKTDTRITQSGREIIDSDWVLALEAWTSTDPGDEAEMVLCWRWLN